jgi:hypothetical protein
VDTMTRAYKVNIKELNELLMKRAGLDTYEP